jgi:hypothetical protein
VSGRSLEWRVADGYLLPQAGTARIPLVSRRLPLGILQAGAFDAATEVYPFLPGDRVFLLSDGVLDTRDRQERLFGVERLQALFAANREPRLLIEDIQQALNSFGGQARDDVSMVEISSLAQPSPAGYKPGLADDGEFSPLDWALSFVVRRPVSPTITGSATGGWRNWTAVSSACICRLLRSGRAGA